MFWTKLRSLQNCKIGSHVFDVGRSSCIGSPALSKSILLVPDNRVQPRQSNLDSSARLSSSSLSPSEFSANMTLQSSHSLSRIYNQATNVLGENVLSIYFYDSELMFINLDFELCKHADVDDPQAMGFVWCRIDH